MKELVRYGSILTLICLLAGGLLAGMNLLTSGRIAAQAANEELESLKEVLPDAESFEPMKEKDKVLYYLARDAEKKLIGLAFKASKKGYSSVIETIAGMTPEGTITGIKILNQNETPGLGGRICEIEEDKTIFELAKRSKPSIPKKPWFQAQFSNKKINELEGIQAITGATISSQAVIDSVKKRSQEILELIKTSSSGG